MAEQIRVRRTKSLERAMALAEEKWPGIGGNTDYLQRIAEQWLNSQDAGTSKTQKIVDIDSRLAEHGKMLAQLTDAALTSAERTEKILQLLTGLIAIVQEMKSDLAEHDLD
ncbi:MAG: hypothetical protein E6Q97_15905 [Desulfurellales bacterium]|nr:MAG: hypothetical protein E6Q97_15905 [Desulfurellales bacterium]